MSSAERSAVEVADVTHRYGAIAALSGVSLSLQAGSSTALVGPDGVGKSTLLGLIAGAGGLQAGTIHTLGSNVASGAQRDRMMPRIAYMPQGLGRNLYPSLSVMENIDYFARLFGHPAAERHLRSRRLLQATGLYPF